MLGHREPYVRIPYFYSDQYELSVEYSGYAPRWDRVVFRGDPAGEAFAAFWLAADRIVAGLSPNDLKVNDAISALVSAGRPVAVDRLVDPAVPLDDLAALLRPASDAR
jgi:3-phenylpropionate/trans-cinnamate dioxygenase ferredoxin reductase subunit